jgi:fermentation-respiration switch protein FrsA (DUF1100 family)
MGSSLGASVLALAAAEVEPPFDAVILDSSFAAAVDLTDSVLHMVPDPLRPLLAGPGVPLASLSAGCDLREARPVDAIAFVRAPLLLIHARDDMLIPVEHAHRLFEQAVEPKELFITDHGGHCSSCGAAGEEYLRKCQALLKRPK